MKLFNYSKCLQNLNTLHKRKCSLQYVPKHDPLQDKDVDVLKNFINSYNKILVLTGAGISTESGIPDYRSEEVGLYARSNHKPIQYQEFVKYAHVRRRYWARNYVGWKYFSQYKPNKTHFTLSRLENELEKISCIITQNVDGLHTKAGSKNVIELHGSLFTVKCLNCNAEYERFYIQERLRESNHGWEEGSTMIRPDGDVELSEEKISTFNPPFCEKCDGVLKPDIVFFGDNVPKSRVEKVKQNVSTSDAILVLGSSLTVFSSYRIILQASEENKRICVVNIGPTRADSLIDVKISAKCGEILSKIFVT